MSDGDCPSSQQHQFTNSLASLAARRSMTYRNPHFRGDGLDRDRLLSGLISRMHQEGDFHGVLELHDKNNPTMNHIHYSNVFDTLALVDNISDCLEVVGNSLFQLLLDDVSDKIENGKFQWDDRATEKCEKMIYSLRVTDSRLLMAIESWNQRTCKYFNFLRL